jgi:ERCC4-type nuclease
VSEDKKVKIILDNREPEEFLHLLEEKGAIVEVKQLEVGDFVCSGEIAVERKARQDFEMSIIDGRLFKQLQNLLENFPKPIVIVEGEERNESEIISKEALMGAYAAVISDFGVSLFFSRDIEETADIVFHLAKHAQLAKPLSLRVFAKRKSLTPSQHQRGVVEALPMVGPKLARALLTHFGSVRAVMNASEEELKEVEKLGEKKAKVIRALIDYQYKPEEDP